MPLFQNQTNKAIIADLSSSEGVIDHYPSGLSNIAPLEIVAGGFHLAKSGLTKLTGGEVLGNVVASNVANVPFGRLTLKSGNSVYEFSKQCHLVPQGSMAADNFELFSKGVNCLVTEDTGNHKFQYQTKIVPNTLLPE